MNPLWLKDIKKWHALSLREKIKQLREYHCKGPCGQSSSVITTRVVLELALKEVEIVLLAKGL